MMQALVPLALRAGMVAVALVCSAGSTGAQTPAAPAASEPAAKTLRPEVATPVNAAQEAARLQRPLWVLLQNKPEVEEPAPEDLHWVGTTATVLHYHAEGQQLTVDGIDVADPDVVRTD